MPRRARARRGSKGSGSGAGGSTTTPARRRRVPSARFSVGELEELPYGEASFGVVTGFGAFQYAADPVHALQEAARVAGSGSGVIAVWGREEDCECVEVATPWEYPDEETALRGMLSAGPAVRAIQAAGEEEVRWVVRQAIGAFRTRNDGYRLENSFCYVVAGGRSAIGALNGP